MHGEMIQRLGKVPQDMKWTIPEFMKIRNLISQFDGDEYSILRTSPRAPFALSMTERTAFASLNPGVKDKKDSPIGQIRNVSSDISMSGVAGP